MELHTPSRKYDVGAKWHTSSWDDTTRQVVRERLNALPERMFFTEHEWDTLSIVSDRLIPQGDPPPVPITPWIDQKLARNQGDGYRYSGMPALRDAWRLGLAAIDAESDTRYSTPFRALDPSSQDAVLRAIQYGNVRSRAWNHVPAKRFFSTILLKTVVGIYYSHPRAWSEVGFGGPASPRGYVRLGTGQRDPWESAADDG